MKCAENVYMHHIQKDDKYFKMKKEVKIEEGVHLEIISSAFNFNRHYRGGTARMKHRPSQSNAIQVVTAVAIKDY